MNSLYKGDYLSKEELKPFEQALKECSERNKRTAKPKLHINCPVKKVGLLQKKLGSTKIKYKPPVDYWLNVKKQKTDRTHKKWFDWKLTTKYNK